MTADVLRKPKWEYGGTFDAAWEGIGLAHPLDDEQKRLLREGMAGAHVVTIERTQLDAIPDPPPPANESGLEELDPKLPFPELYISVSGGRELDYESRLAGFLIETRTGSGLSIATFWRFERKGWRTVVPGTLASFKLGKFVYVWQGMGDETVDSDTARAVDRSIAGADVRRALAVVGFLESANVELGETPVSRQVRRNAARHGTPIASRVYVRPPKHRRDGGGIGERIEFSHRFEVRGHYKHYGPETGMFRATERDKPAKILDHPTRGPVVRIWCPPFVKGPEDKPLVPKVRVVSGVV